MDLLRALSAIAPPRPARKLIGMTMDETEYDLNKRPDKTYMSGSMPSFDDAARKVRIASKAFASQTEHAFAAVKGEVVLRQREGGKRVVKATFYEDNRDISVLNLQAYTAGTDAPHKANFALTGKEITKFLEFVKHIQEHIFKHDHPVNITDEELRRFILSERQATQILLDHPEVLAEVLRTKITKEDIVAVAYRREQLATYARLLNDPEYFAHAESFKKCAGEALWQRFFEKNTWFFGYGLDTCSCPRWIIASWNQWCRGIRWRLTASAPTRS